MLELASLIGFIIFTIGVLVGARFQEVNLRRREQRLAEERRRVNEQIYAVPTRDWT